MSGQSSHEDREKQILGAFAPPRAKIGRTLVENGDLVGSGGQHSRPIRRIMAFRLGGLIGLIFATFVFSAYCFGMNSEIQKFKLLDGGKFDSWRHRVWLGLNAWAMIAVAIAAIMSWGMFRLRNWARLILTAVTTLPLFLLLIGVIYFLILQFHHSIDRMKFADMGLVAALSIFYGGPLIFLMWSPRGRVVFSQDQDQDNPVNLDAWSSFLNSISVLSVFYVGPVFLIMWSPFSWALFSPGYVEAARNDTKFWSRCWDIVRTFVLLLLWLFSYAMFASSVAWIPELLGFDLAD